MSANKKELTPRKKYRKENKRHYERRFPLESMREKDRTWYCRRWYYGDRFIAFLKNNPYWEFRYDVIIFNRRTKKIMYKYIDRDINEAKAEILSHVCNCRREQFVYEGMIHTFRQ